MNTTFLTDRAVKIAEALENRINVSVTRLGGFEYCRDGYKKGNRPPEGAEWLPVTEGLILPGEGHYWLKGKLTVPVPAPGNAVTLLNTTDATDRRGDPQWLIYINGKMISGMDRNHREIFISAEDDGAGLLAYVYVPKGGKAVAPGFSVSETDEETRSLYYDITVPLGILEYSDSDTREFSRIRDLINEAVNLLDLRGRGDEYRESVRRASEYMKREFYGALCGGAKTHCVCIGHTHIDVAWLWTFAQTREKVQRSFSTVVSLMEKYPEYRFMSSQAQLYKYVKEDAPEVYEKIKALVAEGRWEVEGSMWVEADCNLISGESLVRQIIYGKRFFSEEFGVDTRILWLPDVFGYSAALPQILNKSGVDYFLTSKIGWNERDRMPYDLFMWKGIDSSKVMTYFLTAQDKRKGASTTTYSTYNGVIEPRQIAGTWERFQQKELTDGVLHTFGYGDGGGGPTYGMLEKGKRLSRGIPGCPEVRFGKALDFLDNTRDRVKDNKYLPVWSGELYLEYHRGTYTSQARNKKNNRYCEFLYQKLETLSLISEHLSGQAYPYGALRDAWEKILLCQFHDVIPGSSIREVYEDSGRIYDGLISDGDARVSEIYNSITSKIPGSGLVVFNPNSFEASGEVMTDDGYEYVENIPAKGYALVKPSARGEVRVGDGYIENSFFMVEFDRRMAITRIYDKTNRREVLENGARGNVLQAFEDYPRAYDAWEISDYYEEKMWEIDDVGEVTVIREGDRAGYEVTRHFGESVIKQKTVLYGNEPVIDFDTDIDWKNDHILLKAAFPVGVLSDSATYDIQFGTLTRPTHRNTSWDTAKFEVCAHKYADLSEYGYGVSLINDCKYGYDIKDSVMRLTLLKSATSPDPAADKCRHRFSYSLFPHAGGFREAGTVRKAYLKNNPMTAVAATGGDGSLPERYSLVSVSGDNVYCETVKRSEDGKSVVIRLYETYGQRSENILTLGMEPKSVHLCDLLERVITDGETDIDGREVKLSFKPFEIKTLLVYLN